MSINKNFSKKQRKLFKDLIDNNKYLEYVEQLQNTSNYNSTFLLKFSHFCSIYDKYGHKSTDTKLIELYKIYFNNKWFPTSKFFKRCIELKISNNFFSKCFEYGYIMNQTELDMVSDLMIIPKEYITKNNLEINRTVFLNSLSKSYVYKVDDTFILKYFDSTIQNTLLFWLFYTSDRTDIDDIVDILEKSKSLNKFDINNSIEHIQYHLTLILNSSIPNLILTLLNLHKLKSLYIECFTDSFNNSFNNYIIKTNTETRSITINDKGNMSLIKIDL